MSMIDFRRSLGVPDFARMNLPEQFWRAKVHNVPESVRKSVAKYLLNTPSMVEDGIGLLVVGQKGVGKTGIAALVAKESRARGYTVFFTSVWEMREMIRAKARFDDEMSMVDRARL